MIGRDHPFADRIRRTRPYWLRERITVALNAGAIDRAEYWAARLNDYRNAEAEAGPVSDQGSSPAGATGVGERPPVEATE